jgi:hypothetical protein
LCRETILGIYRFLPITRSLNFVLVFFPHVTSHLSSHLNKSCLDSICQSPSRGSPGVAIE